MKKLKLRFLFIATFLLIYGAVFYTNEYYKNVEILDELNKAAKELKLNFDISNYHNTEDAEAIEKLMINRGDIIQIMSKAVDADEIQRAKLRNELYNKLSVEFKSMQYKGVTVVLFAFEDNTVFLRLHKPSKYGDNLQNVRRSIVLTNKTHTRHTGFEQGKITHAFRNVFPLYNKQGRFIGSVDISYATDKIQNVISNINKIHTHLLIKKSVFDVKIWQKDGVKTKYRESIENPDYMLTLGREESHLKANIGKKMIFRNKNYILKSMQESKQFSIYSVNDKYADIISFVPIKNLKNATAAYLVSYTQNEHIVDILNFFKIINILIFITLIIGLYFTYRQILIKNIMQAEIDTKTQELQNANTDLEEKIMQRTNEQNQLLSLFNKGAVSLFKWKNDEQLSIEYASNNTKEIFGYTKEEFLSGDIGHANIIHKDDGAVFFQEVADALEKDLDFFVHKPYRIISKDSKEVWVLDNTLIIKDSNGKVTHFLGYISNITELKENELEIKAVKERFQLAIDGANDGLWDWNIETNEVYFSPRWKSMLGYEEDEISNSLQEWRRRVHPADIDKAFFNIQEHLLGKTEVYENIHRMKHKNDSWIWVLDRGKALFDSNSKAIRMVGFHTDITRNKELEENLQHLVEEKTAENIKQGEALQQQSKMAAMGEMIGAIAHQWRQPLNVLSVNIQNLEYEYEDNLVDKKFIKEFIEKNNRTISFMSNTIDDFRNFFRVDKEKSYFSVKKAIESSLSMQSAQLKSHNIDSSITGDDFEVNGYESEFIQVILNLINNAKDALIDNEIEKPEINIILKKNKVLIEDNAGGIKEDVLNRIFEPYFTTKEQGKGTGLGLYVSKMIIEDNMGAALKVSNIANGAMFEIDFN
ncbi:PAS domain-containing protein [Sulfurimonas sp.]|uniref:PAS domain-containing sensor histidine kinase n=1 Tax=Sulfurimonas sp. TaxID=2022749 RepID=UPI0035676305